MAKQNTMLWVFGLIFVLLIVGGGASLPKLDLTNFQLPDLLGGETGNLVSVNRVLDFTLTNEYAGSALATKTLVIYDSDGHTQLESLTTGADGTITSAFTYPSDKVIYVKYVSSNDKEWWKITVPKMAKQDAEVLTVNAISLKSFAIGTYSTDTLKFGATSIADAGSYNKTASGSTPTFTYSLANTGNDNTGLKDSYDPIYGENWWTVVYVTFTTGNYETVLVYDMDYNWESGSTTYHAERLNAYALTKHKVGNTYLSKGTQDVVFSLDLTGYSGDTTVMQFYVYAYSDPSWCQAHGNNYGTSKVEIAEHTVTLTD